MVKHTNQQGTAASPMLRNCKRTNVFVRLDLEMLNNFDMTVVKEKYGLEGWGIVIYIMKFLVERRTDCRAPIYAVSDIARACHRHKSFILQLIGDFPSLFTIEPGNQVFSSPYLTQFFRENSTKKEKTKTNLDKLTNETPDNQELNPSKNKNKEQEQIKDEEKEVEKFDVAADVFEKNKSLETDAKKTCSAMAQPSTAKAAQRRCCGKKKSAVKGAKTAASKTEKAIDDQAKQAELQSKSSGSAARNARNHAGADADSKSSPTISVAPSTIAQSTTAATLSSNAFVNTLRKKIRQASAAAAKREQAAIQAPTPPATKVQQPTAETPTAAPSAPLSINRELLALLYHDEDYMASLEHMANLAVHKNPTLRRNLLYWFWHYCQMHGKAMRNAADAKDYLANLMRPGSNTRARFMAYQNHFYEQNYQVEQGCGHAPTRQVGRNVGRV
ncbi:FERM and PDZ domain-containing protein 3 [Segatella salivae]|uniref:DUF7833 domain-containing protein n=1 Tax=Segatella salivae TaxID=228604 RepID=UPI00248DBFDA|nr:FERM and PDZ domain-containing protein 3 [Segatella salivae]